MVWIKILFPVQAFPLSGYRFPICRCLKYCPQKIICRCDPLRPGTEKSGHRYSGIRLRHCSGHLRAYHLSAACCSGFPHIQLHSHRSRRDCSKNTSSLNLSEISKTQFQKFKENADSSFHSGDKYYNCCTLSNGWLHVTEIPESYIQGNTHILIRALLITVLIFLPLTVIIVILFSENLTRKITALSYAMETFQLGHDPEHLSIVTVPHPDDPSRYDEIDRLGITFEDMQHTIAGNLKSIVNLSVNEERLKYQLLQSQINPHFLYNILGSIRTCQSLGKLDIADQMIADLTAFYRLTLRKSKELIPIKDELKLPGFIWKWKSSVIKIIWTGRSKQKMESKIS